MNEIRNSSEDARVRGFFKSGMNSFPHPTDPSLPEDGYSFAENTQHRGGIVQTRQGFSLKFSKKGSKIQGFKITNPRSGEPRALLAVDGEIWTAPYPFTDFVKVPGLSFDPDAEFIVMERTIQSAKLKLDGTIELVTPREVIIFQDGSSIPGFWTGSTGGHTNKIPIGLWMRWVNNRLWVVAGSRVEASDLSNPLAFSENEYLAERSAFELPDVGTGIIGTSDEQGLLVFTDSTTTSLKSGILNRTDWQKTPDFQRVILPEVGCVAGRSAINQYGLTIWLSKRGLVSLDTAMFTQQTSQLLTLDDPMYRSKRIVSSNKSSVCAAHFESTALFSVPAGDRYNAQTWLMDAAPSGESMRSSPTWSSVWTGARPVEWSAGNIGGRERIYFASYGAVSLDGERVHVWEAFINDRKDNGGRIRCQLELGAFTSIDRKRMKYIEIDACEILGEVNVQAYIGGTFGPWYEILDVTLRAQEGSIGAPGQTVLTNDTIMRAYRPQSRRIRSREFTQQGKECQHEGDIAGIDKGFQILIQWRGQMGVKAVKIVTDNHADSGTGECVEDESTAIAITEAGEGA